MIKMQKEQSEADYTYADISFEEISYCADYCL